MSFSPIAWFDEVYFASTTHSFMNGNGLSLELDHCEPVLMYGPIYFLLTSSVMKLFGFGIQRKAGFTECPPLKGPTYFWTLTS